MTALTSYHVLLSVFTGPLSRLGTSKALFKAPVYDLPVPPLQNPSEDKIAVIHAKSSKYKASLARGSATGDVEESLKRLEELANTPKEVQNPVTKKHRAELESDFKGLLAWLSPSWHWLTCGNRILSASIPRCIFVRAWVIFISLHNHLIHIFFTPCLVRARGGGTSRWSLSEDGSLFIFGTSSDIVMMKKGKAGFQVLIKGELYPKLEQEMLPIIMEYNLERHRDPVICFGRTEVQVMVEACLDRLERLPTRINCVYHREICRIRQVRQIT